MSPSYIQITPRSHVRFAILLNENGKSRGRRVFFFPSDWARPEDGPALLVWADVRDISHVEGDFAKTLSGIADSRETRSAKPDISGHFRTSAQRRLFDFQRAHGGTWRKSEASI